MHKRLFSHHGLVYAPPAYLAMHVMACTILANVATPGRASFANDSIEWTSQNHCASSSSTGSRSQRYEYFVVSLVSVFVTLLSVVAITPIARCCVFLNNRKWMPVPKEDEGMESSLPGDTTAEAPIITSIAEEHNAPISLPEACGTSVSPAAVSARACLPDYVPIGGANETARESLRPPSSEAVPPASQSYSSPAYASALLVTRFSRYQLRYPIGNGAYSTVFLVERKRDRRLFAMKYLVCPDEKARAMALREYDMIHSLQGHPNIISLKHVFMSFEESRTPNPVEALETEACTFPRTSDAQVGDERQHRSGSLHNRTSIRVMGRLEAFSRNDDSFHRTAAPSSGQQAPQSRGLESHGCSAIGHSSTGVPPMEPRSTESAATMTLRALRCQAVQPPALVKLPGDGHRNLPRSLHTPSSQSDRTVAIQPCDTTHAGPIRQLQDTTQLSNELHGAATHSGSSSDSDDREPLQPCWPVEHHGIVPEQQTRTPRQGSCSVLSGTDVCSLSRSSSMNGDPDRSLGGVAIPPPPPHAQTRGKYGSGFHSPAANSADGASMYVPAWAHVQPHGRYTNFLPPGSMGGGVVSPNPHTRPTQRVHTTGVGQKATAFAGNTHTLHFSGLPGRGTKGDCSPPRACSCAGHSTVTQTGICGYCSHSVNVRRSYRNLGIVAPTAPRDEGEAVPEDHLAQTVSLPHTPTMEGGVISYAPTRFVRLPYGQVHYKDFTAEHDRLPSSGVGGAHVVTSGIATAAGLEVHNITAVSTSTSAARSTLDSEYAQGTRRKAEKVEYVGITHSSIYAKEKGQPPTSGVSLHASSSCNIRPSLTATIGTGDHHRTRSCNARRLSLTTPQSKQSSVKSLQAKNASMKEAAPRLTALYTNVSKSSDSSSSASKAISHSLTRQKAPSERATDEGAAITSVRSYLSGKRVAGKAVDTMIGTPLPAKEPACYVCLVMPYYPMGDLCHYVLQQSGREQLPLCPHQETVVSVEHEGRSCGRAAHQITHARNRIGRSSLTRAERRATTRDVFNGTNALPIGHDRVSTGARGDSSVGHTGSDDTSSMSSNPGDRNALTEAQLCSIAYQLALALCHLHTQHPPIIHRDVKPENILIRGQPHDVIDTEEAAAGENTTHDEASGRYRGRGPLPARRITRPIIPIVLADFGLAVKEEHSGRLRRCGGTLPYVSPESWRGEVTTAGDMWSMGCVLYALAVTRLTVGRVRDLAHESKYQGFASMVLNDILKHGYSLAFASFVVSLLVVDPVKRPTAAMARRCFRVTDDAIAFDPHCPFFSNVLDL